jgi:outer membrane lipoprotein SlyB
MATRNRLSKSPSTRRSLAGGLFPLFALVGLWLAGCASAQPVLYPNDTLKQQGKETAQAAIQQCEASAKRNGADSGRASQMAKGTAEGGAIGGAAGAAAGAVRGHPGRGAATGAAAGAAGTFIHGLFSSSQPSATYKRYVNQCLRDKGYQPVGWK